MQSDLHVWPKEMEFSVFQQNPSWLLSSESEGIVYLCIKLLRFWDQIIYGLLSLLSENIYCLSMLKRRCCILGWHVHLHLVKTLCCCRYTRSGTRDFRKIFCLIWTCRVPIHTFELCVVLFSLHSLMAVYG